MPPKLQLQLNVVKVRLARPDRAGHDPAPAGTHVWLDVPTGNLRDFSFQEFVVNSSGSLDAAGANAGKNVSIDSSVTYWSLWSAPGSSLKLPAKFDPDNLDIVAGFGRPLLAVLTDQKELVLPNTRKLIFREFNLSGLGETPEMKTNKQKAQDFYKDLHIELEFQPQSRPAGQSDIFMALHGNKMSLHDVKDLQNWATADAVELPLRKAPWIADPPATKPKTVVLIWINSSMGSSIKGKTFQPFRLLPPQAVSEMLPHNTPDYSFSFMVADAKFGTFTGQQGPGPLAHELGHVLWADPGAGRKWYNSTQLSDADRATYQSRINDVFIKELGFDVPPDKIAAQLLESEDHHHLANNIMNPAPDNTPDVPNGLTFIQIALFRRASELIW